jgi:hypothetical protein
MLDITILQGLLNWEYNVILYSQFYNYLLNIGCINDKWTIKSVFYPHF